ncbi:hypothetical protein IP92_05488 [Pseudoduganella flava]|uniref:Uncharacterized protein n=1 Tax=Pseudoduganella flava TaxID=871742 RepID=A0A562PDD5_9BURK|nr:hypothetical protein [Pseudoduganella flava]QGZ42117.1 hypothetical protein GO485_25785 [Pseudoduganella flava]TWI42512.1 hypothetical protein IP92_05488 [Pseudoduganella flava]
MFSIGSNKPAHQAENYELRDTRPAAPAGEDATSQPSGARPHQGGRAVQLVLRQHAPQEEGESSAVGSSAHKAPEPDDVEATIVSPGVIAAAADLATTPADNAASAAFHRAKREMGSTREALDAAVAELGGRYVRSQSAGVPLASLNDHDGVLVLPFANRHMTVTEHLAVVKDKVSVPGSAEPEERYFVKGYANRLVSLKELKAFNAADHDGKPDGERMETSFRTHLMELSRASQLMARRTAQESEGVVMPVPPNAMPFPRRVTWANAENYMAAGFGGRPLNAQGRGSPFDAGYADYNAIENRLVIFLTDAAEHEKAHPQQQRRGKHVPASVNIEGSVVAELSGIASVETMGPVGTPGVKLAGLRNLLHHAPSGLHLRITTEDGAVHDLRYTDNGLKMRLVYPKEPGVDMLAPLDNAHTSLYSYQGRSTGVFGSVEGFSNPEIVLSTGEALLAGPLMVDRTSLLGHARAGGKLLLNLVTLDPAIGARDARVMAALNTAVKAVCTAASVWAFTHLINSQRDEHTHALLPGARPFTGGGAGVVDAVTLAKAIGVTVVVQSVLTPVFAFLQQNLLKDSWKSRETVGGQLFNEGAVPYATEFTRLLFNYGIQKHMGLPRGDGHDVATLVGVAGLLTASNAVMGRAGNRENHPAARMVADTVNFFIGDLLLRSLGAVAGNPTTRHDMTQRDYQEAFVTRMATRGFDKWLAPILVTALSAAGLLGPNNNVVDDQVSREARYNGVAMSLQDFGRSLSTAGTKLLKKGDAKLEDVEWLAGALHSTGMFIEDSHKKLNRMMMAAQPGDAAELQRVQDAAGFADLDADAQVAYLERMTERFNEMVEATLPTAQPGPSSAAAASAAPAQPGTQPVSNSRAQLPPEIEPMMSRLMNEFVEGHDRHGPNYPTVVSPDFLGPALPHGAEGNRRIGGKTARVPQALTTFSEAPAAHIARVHNAMEGVRGMPESPDDSMAQYQRLSARIIRDILTSTVKYTQESGFFHYLLRWAQTGQPYFTQVVPGVHLTTEMMNKRGNVAGDEDQQISPRDPLLINLGALHAKKFPAIVQRAVVTDAAYFAQTPDQPLGRTITEQERISLSEILSTTSAETLAAAFLAALGYGAAADERSLRIVMNQDTAVNISKYTELMQAETISMPGGIFVVNRVDANPPARLNADGTPAENLGQVVYMSRVNTYDLENNYREWQEARARGETPPLADGALGIEPASGHFFRYDSKSNDMTFVVASKNYFLGTEVERSPDQPARWRYPYTSPASPRGMLDFINAALLLDDPIKPYLNDATRNIHHEEDMRRGGYYDDGNAVRARHEAALAETRTAAGKAAAQLNALRADTVLTAQEGEACKGHLLAKVAAGALRKPLLMLEVGADGQVVLEHGEPKKLATIDKTWDGVDLRWEKAGPTMIGVGPNGFHALGYRDGVLTSVPVKVDGDGATAGNLLHTIMASAYPNPAGSRYTLRNGAVRTVGGAMARLPGMRDEVKATSGQLLGKLQDFAGSDYVPLQSWLSTQVGGQPYPRPETA